MAKTKIRWAFDPYTEVEETWKRSKEVLAILAKSNDADVIPTYTLGYGMVHWVGNVTPMQVEKLEPIVEKVMNSRLEQLKIAGLAQPEIVTSPAESLQDDATFTAEFFNKDQPDLVVINTHARKGLKRIFMGSFSESVLLKSAVPVLFVSPNTSPIESIDTVLVPTDLSERAQKDFASYLDQPFFKPKRIVLFSKVIHPVTSVAESTSYVMGGGWVSLDQFLEDTSKERQALAEKWKQLGEKKGFAVKTVLKEGPGDLIDDILDVIDSEKVDLIDMSSYATRLDTLLVGSHAREVVRNCRIPVLVRPRKA